MRFAAFFRNLNLGRTGHPTTAQFTAALEAAGARDAVSVLSHGNAAFSAPGARQATLIAQAACIHMQHTCGWNGAVHVRSIRQLARLIAAEPFATAPADGIHERCVTFLPANTAGLPALPLCSARRDLEIFRIEGGEAFSVTRLVGGRPGNVNGLLERLLRAPLTSRNWNTVMRVVERHG